MNSWSGLKARKAGDSHSDPRASEQPANLSLDLGSSNPQSLTIEPSSLHNAPAGTQTQPMTQGQMGYSGRGSPRESPSSSKSMEVVDRFGRLIQDWAAPSRPSPQYLGNPSVPSSPSVARLIGQQPIANLQPRLGGHTMPPNASSLLAELWRPKPGGDSEEGPWLHHGFPRLPASDVNTPQPAQGVLAPGSNAPVDPPPALLPPSLSSRLEQLDYRLPFSSPALEQQMHLPRGLDIARVIDAKPQPQALEPNYYDFLQLEGRATLAAQGQARLGAHSDGDPSRGGGGQMQAPRGLPLTGDPFDVLPLMYRKRAETRMAVFKVPTVVPPHQMDHESLDKSPNQPDTPSNLGLPIAKDPAPWEDGSVHEAKAQGGLEEGLVREDSKGGNELKLGFSHQSKGGFEAFRNRRGGGAFMDAADATAGGPGVAAKRPWSAGPARSPPGSPPRALSDSEVKRTREVRLVAGGSMKRPRLTLGMEEARLIDDDDDDDDQIEGGAQKASPQEGTPATATPELPTKVSDDLDRQLTDAQRQLSDARRQLANAEASWEADRRQWRQKESAWEAFRTARMLPSGGSPSVTRGSPAVARGGRNGSGEVPRYSDDEIGRVLSERLIRTESMLIAALAEIGRLRAWASGMRTPPRAPAGAPMKEESASGDVGRT